MGSKLGYLLCNNVGLLVVFKWGYLLGDNEELICGIKAGLLIV